MFFCRTFDPTHFPRPVSPWMQEVYSFDYGIEHSHRIGCLVKTIKLRFVHGFAFTQVSEVMTAREGHRTCVESILNSLSLNFITNSPKCFQDLDTLHWNQPDVRTGPRSFTKKTTANSMIGSNLSAKPFRRSFAM